MPVAIIDIPSGVTTNAKNQLHKDVAESMHAAYQIADNRVYLREWAAEQTSFDGWLARRFARSATSLFRQSSPSKAGGCSYRA